MTSEALRSALAAKGLPEDWAPEAPSPKVALTRALRECADGALRLERLSDGSFAITEVRERGRVPGEKDDVTKRAIETRPIAMVRVDGVGRVRMSAEDDFDETTQALIDRVKEAHVRHSASVAAADVGTWLAHRMGDLDGVALRERGGVYFVARHALDKLTALSQAVEESTACRLHTVPALESDEASAAVFEAVVREATAEAEALRADIANDDVGARAMATRITRAEAYERKLERFQTILGDRMDALREEAAKVTVAVYAAHVVRAGREG